MNECNSVVLQKVKTGFWHSCQFGMVKLRVLLCLSKKQKWYYCWEMTSRNSRHSDIYLRIAELRGEEEQHFYPSWLRTSLSVKLREKEWMGALRCEPGPPVPWCQGSVTTPVLPPPYASAVLACIQHSHLCWHIYNTATSAWHSTASLHLCLQRAHTTWWQDDGSARQRALQSMRQGVRHWRPIRRQPTQVSRLPE